MSDFKPLKPNRGPADITGDIVKKGYIKFTNYALYFGEATFDELGKPEYIKVSVDDKRHLIQLMPADTKREGYRLQMPRRDHVTRWMIRPSRHPMMKNMPRGVYIPTGGGVYAYKEEVQPK